VVQVGLALANPTSATFFGAMLAILAVFAGVARGVSIAGGEGFAGDCTEQQRCRENGKPQTELSSHVSPP